MNPSDFRAGGARCKSGLRICRAVVPAGEGADVKLLSVR
jgi:hypothetical protein